MKTPPLSSCQYTSQALKARKPAAEKNRRKNRYGWRPASSMYCRRHSSCAAFFSGVKGRSGVYLTDAAPAYQDAQSVPQSFTPKIIS